MRSRFVLAILLFAAALAGPLNAQTPSGWPQYRGPNRDGISRETGLLKQWPANGPAVVWKSTIGEGYSGIAVAGGRLYTMDSDGKNDFVVCLDAASGKQLWRYDAGVSFENDQGSGPRSTPTVDGEWVYAVTPKALLIALSARDGKKVWSHDLAAEFGSEIPQWGTSTSPLVEKDLLMVDVGGKKDYSLMAFNKKDGTIAWHAETDNAGYSSPIAVTIGGIRQIIFFTGTGLISVAPQGKVYWRYPWRTSYSANIATPIFIAPDKIFISTGYDTGAAVLQIKTSGDQASANEVWKSRVMKNHFNSSVLYGGSIYGFDDATFKCINAQTGQEGWKTRGMGKGSLIVADGRLVVLGDTGKLSLVDAAPEEFKEISSFQALDGKSWTMPSLADGKLYLRNQKQIVCLDIKESKS